MTLFFISAWPVFAYSGPLRPPMWGGEPIMKDPEVVVAAATTGGGDAAYPGVHPGTPQQSVAEQGQMKPLEPDIDVKVVARVYHLIDSDTEKYIATRFEIEAQSTVKVNDEELRMISTETLEDEIWIIAPEEVKTVVEKAESDVAEKAFNFLKARRELLETLKAAKVEVILEKVVSEEYFDDDFGDDP